MNCQYPVDRGAPTFQPCGALARWLVRDRVGHEQRLCTIHKMTAVRRDPSLEVSQL